MNRHTALLLAIFLAAGAAGPSRAEQPARDFFGAATQPAAPPGLGARTIGSYAKGCLAEAVALPVDGESWAAMRLSRNRNWGHPALIDYVEELAAAARADGWPGLLVGDLSQPRGGPMNGGHASHQIGLDADLWLTPMPAQRPDNAARESLGATSMLAAGTRSVDPAIWTDAHARLIRRAALGDRVARIFVHPGIKQALCQGAGEDRAWLSKVRPWWGHDSHFHVRLKCPAGESACKDQAPPPAGDGCGTELDYWLSDEPWTPKDPPAPPAAPLTVADLPAACRAVLAVP